MSHHDRACPTMRGPSMGRCIDAEIEIVMLDTAGKMRNRRVVPLLDLIVAQPASEMADWPDQRHMPPSRRARL